MTDHATEAAQGGLQSLDNVDLAEGLAVSDLGDRLINSAGTGVPRAPSSVGRRNLMYQVNCNSFWSWLMIRDG
jgi:hypothetical protein